MKPIKGRYLDTDAEVFRTAVSSVDGKPTLLGVLAWVLYYQMHYGQLPCTIGNFEHYPVE